MLFVRVSFISQEALFLFSYFRYTFF